MDGSDVTDITTDQDISTGVHLEADDSPSELDTSERRRSELRQKASYLINAHESINIGFSNFLSIATVAFEAYQSDENQPSLDDRLGDDKNYSLAAAVACSFTFAIAWLLVIHKKLENKKYLDKTNYFVDIKHELNPWYRSFKACASLGNSVGQALIELVFLIPGFSLIPASFKVAVKTAAAAFLGLLFGMIGGLLLPKWWGADDIRKTPDSSLFHVGKDGWGRYAKTGISLGALIGGAIGAILGFFTPIPGGMALGIALGNSLGGIIGFAIAAISVPVINYLINFFSPPSAEDAKKTIKDNPYRTKYMRTGLAFGVYVGTIIGFALGAFFPAFGTTALFITVCAAIGAIAGMITFAIAGPKMNRWLSEKDLSYSSFDFGAGTGGMAGQMVSNVFAASAILIGFGIEKLTELICAIGGMIGSIIGGAYDGYQTRKLSNQADAKKTAFEEALKQKLTADAQKFNELKAKFKNNPNGLSIEELAKISLTEDEYIKEKENEHRKKEAESVKKEFEHNQPFLPWSQRVGVFLTYGSMVGGAIGFLIGTMVGGPAIGFLLGTGTAAFVSLAVGLAWGEKIYKKYVQFSEWIASSLFGIKTSGVTTPTKNLSPTNSPNMSQRSSTANLLSPGSPIASTNSNSTNKPSILDDTIDVPPPSTPPPPPPPAVTNVSLPSAPGFSFSS